MATPTLPPHAQLPPAGSSATRDLPPSANRPLRPTAASSWSAVARSSSDVLPRRSLEIRPISLVNGKYTTNGGTHHHLWTRTTSIRAKTDQFRLLLFFTNSRKQIAISSDSTPTPTPPTVKRSRWDVEQPRTSILIDPAQKEIATKSRSSLSLPTPPAQSPSYSSPSFSSTLQPRSPEPVKVEAVLPRDWYKPKGTKDYKVVYDPLTDAGSIKKGKDLVYRYDGDGVQGKVVDPRTTKSMHKSSKTRTLLVDTVALLTYSVSRFAPFLATKRY